MKKFILGFVTGALCFGALGAYAAGGKMIEVFYGVNDIKINKVSQIPEQKPFLYNGTTYVPLKFVAEKLGQPVKWDGKSRTIWIGQFEEETAVYPGNGIQHSSYQEGGKSSGFTYSYNEGKKISDTLSNEFDKYLIMNTGYGADFRPSFLWNEISFPLNGQYKEFKAKLGLTRNSITFEGTANLDILVDDESVYTKTLKVGDMGEEIKLSISGASKITFKLSSSNEPVEIGLFDARFIK